MDKRVRHADPVVTERMGQVHRLATKVVKVEMPRCPYCGADYDRSRALRRIEKFQRRECGGCGGRFHVRFVSDRKEGGGAEEPRGDGGQVTGNEINNRHGGIEP